MEKPRILVCSGPQATIMNSPPLVTSDKARSGGESDGSFDHLVPQYLHEPVTVKIEPFSGHPLEEDAKDVYHEPEAEYHEVTLEPEDGLYLLPYMARRADDSDDGTPFEADDLDDPELDFGGRQFFYPDASRIFEEIDRSIAGRDKEGTGNLLSEKAEYDFIRPLPSGGYTQEGETLGEDYFPYEPEGNGRIPGIENLGIIVNEIQHHLNSGSYDGVIWLEGSPRLEETLYWLQLLVDTDVPIVGHVSNRRHGLLSNEGDRNIVNGVEYIVSGKGDGLGAVAIQDQLVYAAREFKKSDARPGGFTTIGGQGGVLGSVGFDVRVQFRPEYKHTQTSELNLTSLPETLAFTDMAGDDDETTIQIKADGDLIETEIPIVSLVKGRLYGSGHADGSPDREVDIMGRIEQALSDREDADRPDLHGLVFEGSNPYVKATRAQDNALEIAAFSGLPVVRVSRGDPGGFVEPHPEWPTIEGSNLDANKAAMLLTAAMLTLGRLPRAEDPRNPTDAEREALLAKIDEFQRIFDTH